MPAQTQRTFTIHAPLNRFPVKMCFNQFSVEKTDLGTLVTFGYLWNRTFLENVFSCSINAEALEGTRETTLQYLGRLGEIMPMEFQVIRPASSIVPVNILAMSFRGPVAETAFHNFAVRQTLAEAKEAEFDAEAVALLISPLNVQRHLIKALYE